MKSIKAINEVPFPSGDLTDNFSFSTIHPDGIFKFHFRYMNNRWNVWVTLPSGEVRCAGVEPNVTSWSGFLDYGLVFSTEMTEIAYSSLFDTTLYILTWE